MKGARVLDREIIQTRGFRNVGSGDEITGFELALRMPSYRGMWASLIDGAEVTVDGETWDKNRVLWTFAGKTYTLDELQHTDDVRWQLEDAAILTVPKSGGLSRGTHEVSVKLELRMSYIPVEFQPTVIESSRKATIIS